MIYSIGLSSEELSVVGLEADKIFDGREIVFDKDNSLLKTFDSLDSYEGYEELNREDVTLLPGDTVIVSWQVALATLEQMRRKKIKIMVVETDHQKIIGLLTYATY